MDVKEGKKNIFNESKCSRCGKEYPEFNVVEDGQVKNKGYYPDCDCFVEIKLKKWQIPILLAAADLGEMYEGIYSRLSEATELGIDRYDQRIPDENDSWVWREHVESTIDQIKSQTGINLEYWESADKDNILSDIHNVVNKMVAKRINEFSGNKINREWLYRNYQTHLKYMSNES